MSKHENIDFLLKNSLKPEYEPTDMLNQKVLRRAKESKMKKRKKRPAAVAAVLIGVALLGSATSYAAWKYLTPSEVASDMFENKYLAEAFKGENAIRMNEQRKGGGYVFTLLGITSGKELNGYLDESGQQLNESESYAVIAIENADGTPMPKECDISRFLITPLLGDQDPWQVNIYSFDGFATEIARDGISYRIISCNDLNMFADRGVFLAVCHDLSDLKEGYTVNKDDGIISENESFSGLNVIFKLPLDAAKADRERAEQVLYEILNPVAEEMNETDKGNELYVKLPVPEDLKTWLSWLESGMPGNDVSRRCHRIDGSEQTVSADESGGYKLYCDGKVREYIEREFLNQSGDWQVISYTSEETVDSLEIIMYRYNEDGTVTFAGFTPDAP